MKQIKVTESNADAIEHELARVNGKAWSHTITNWRDIRDEAERAEKMLADRGVPKSIRSGASATYTPAGPRANAYKYEAASTEIEIVRRSSAWYLARVSRTGVWPKQAEKFQITITRAQADAILRHAMSGMVLRADEQEAAA